MTISNFGACVVVVAMLAGGALAQPASQPAPEITVDNIISALPPPASGGAANQSGDCPRNFARGDSGQCEPLKGPQAGFSLIGPGPAASPPPAQGARASDAPPAPPPAGINLLLTFEKNSAALTPQGSVNARVFAQAMDDPRLRGAIIEIEGHTDASGGKAYNLSLSRRRAEAVKQFLVSRGVSANRLKTIGYGYERLANPSDPLSGENRRVVAHRIQ